MKFAMAALSVTGMVGLSLTAAGASTKRPHAAVVPLVLYSAQGYDHAMAAAFTKATGIPVNLDDDSTGPLLTKIETEKNNPQWNVFWVDGSTAFAGLDHQHLLLRGLKLNSSIKLNALGKQSGTNDNSWIPTGVTLMGALLTNSKKVANPPKTYNALLSPQWKGQVGMNDPTQSGPTYPLIAGVMNYLGRNCSTTACKVRAGENYFSKLKADTNVVINTTNGPTIAALTAGQINIALVQSSAATGAMMGDKSLAVHYLSPSTLLPSCIGVDAKAKGVVKAEAEKFINFVLSKAGQHVMQTGDPTGDSLYYPVVNGVKPLPTLPSLKGVTVQSISPYIWGNEEPNVNNWFTNHITQ